MTAFASQTCNVCGSDKPHAHSPHEVERARYCRPAFEEYFKLKWVRAKVHPGFNPSGTYGWCLSFWKYRNSEGNYLANQTQVAWEIWKDAWSMRGTMFPEMQAACELACGVNPNRPEAPT